MKQNYLKSLKRCGIGLGILLSAWLLLLFVLVVFDLTRPLPEPKIETAKEPLTKPGKDSRSVADTSATIHSVLIRENWVKPDQISRARIINEQFSKLEKEFQDYLQKKNTMTFQEALKLLRGFEFKYQDINWGENAIHKLWPNDHYDKWMSRWDEQWRDIDEAEYDLLVENKQWGQALRVAQRNLHDWDRELYCARHWGARGTLYISYRRWGAMVHSVESIGPDFHWPHMD